MELKVSEYQLPEALSFNYEELKLALTEKVKLYANMVYTDDQIKQAKADRADLNRLKKALNDERLRREKEYMAPFNEFKAKINEIIAIIDKPASIIDHQVKEFEEKQKQEKKEEIKQEFETLGLPDYVTFDKVFNPAWLNSSCPVSRIRESFKDIKYRHEKNIEALSALTEYSFEALEYYKQDLDFAGAITQATKLSEMARAKKAAEEEAAKRAEQERIEAERREAIEAVKIEEPAEVEEEVEPASWVKFEALLTTENALALKDFFESNNIAFRPILEEE